MEIDFTCDVFGDVFSDKLWDEFYDSRLVEFYASRNYGNDEISIFIVLNCKPRELKLRKRLDNKEKCLYWDVMLNYKATKKANMEGKRKLVAQGSIDSFDILDNYKKLHVNKELIKQDTTEFFIKLGWLKDG